VLIAPITWVAVCLISIGESSNHGQSEMMSCSVGSGILEVLSRLKRSLSIQMLYVLIATKNLVELCNDVDVAQTHAFESRNCQPVRTKDLSAS
jgi:hypothetical protein